MANPKPQDVLGRITLVTGPEEFLGERAIDAVRAVVRRHDAEAELSETMAGSLTMAELGDLAAPSLFSSTRCVVVRRLEDLPDRLQTEIEHFFSIYKGPEGKEVRVDGW